MKRTSNFRETVFAGWDRPLLIESVKLLQRRFESNTSLDLSNLLCVLPSGLGVGRLKTLLAERARTESLQYRSPDIITIGQLPERLYLATSPLALEFEQTLAWANVLRQMRADELLPLIPTVPPREPISPWLDLAGIIRRLHEELASSKLTFHNVFEAAETESEKRRWKLLSHLLDLYRDAIEKAGLSDPHAQRQLAVENQRCRTDKLVVLIGTSDLSDAAVSMLSCLSGNILSFVAAPKSKSDHFDSFGCVVTEKWIGHHLPLLDEHLIPAADVSDQATAVAEFVQDLGSRYSSEQITIGVTDPSQVGPIEVTLRGCGVGSFRHLGWTVSQTAIGRLLTLTANHLQRRTWQSLASLVRHADVARMITSRLNEPNSEKWLTQLDQLLSNHFPVRVDKPLPANAIRTVPLAIAACEAVTDWLSEFESTEGHDSDRPIAQWSKLIASWLGKLYESDTEKPESQSGERTLLALAASLQLIQRFADLNTGLDMRVSGAAAIEMLAGRLGDVRIAGAAKSDDLEIVGWLDLALDDKPAMVVAGFNHPFVPGATTSDPFLPGSLRTKLRMADNDRRYARDAYAMQVMLSSRTDIRFIVGKSKADGTPTPPSRLLAAAPPEDSARRIRFLLGKPRVKSPVHLRWDATTSNAAGSANGSHLLIPTFNLNREEDVVTAMSVTAFRDYLACPYRFYLRHVLKLRPLDDASRELAANQFGDLVHGALERFGDSPQRTETQASKIEANLLEHLHQYASDHYGSDASTAVAIQIAQAERRLKAVALVQAERINQAWTIHASEAVVDQSSGAGIEVDGKWMGLKGRFDRIDFHSQSGRWAILDYKTHGHKPEKKHLDKTPDGYRWIDLQLPLYRMMIPFLGIDAPPADVSLGYFNISEKEDETRINLAEFSESQMIEAEELIRNCVRNIWAKKFAPTRDRVQFDDYSMILQTGVASRMLDEVDSWDAEEIEV